MTTRNRNHYQGIKFDQYNEVVTILADIRRKYNTNKNEYMQKKLRKVELDLI